MRYLLIALSLLLSTQVYADDKHENCLSFASLAREVMNARQNGVSMIELMEATESEDDEANKYIRTVIEVAYGSPRYGTEYYKQKEVTEYEAAAYISCMNDFN